MLNPFNDRYDDFVLDWDTSAAEKLQETWPGARIVSTFKWPLWEAFENANFDGAPMDIVYTGNDQEPTEVVLHLFRATPSPPLPRSHAPRLAPAPATTRPPPPPP